MSDGTNTSPFRKHQAVLEHRLPRIARPMTRTGRFERLDLPKQSRIGRYGDGWGIENSFPH